MAEAKRYPFDCSDLDKGSVVTADTVAASKRMDKTDPKFGIEMMKAKQFIYDQMELRGLFITIAIVDGDIHILTDEEAATYNRKRFGSGLGIAFQSHDRNLHVDPTPLTDIDRQNHERTLINHGRVLQAIKEVKKHIAAVPYVRDTPTLA